MSVSSTQDEAATAAKRGGGSWLYIFIWLFYLIIPIRDLMAGEHSTGQVVWVALGIGAFCACYFVVFRSGFPEEGVAEDNRPRRWLLMGLLALLALLLPVFVYRELFTLWIYVSAAAGVTLPLDRLRSAVLGGLVSTTAMLVEGYLLDASVGSLGALVLPCLFTCLGSIGARKTRLLIHELRTAREEVKQLAVTEERLRMARDLHDLAGHSLATITLKAELARRLIDADPAAAAKQLADLELVSRQALTDIREAVSGYRRPTLAVELLSSRTALAAAGMTFRAGAELANATCLDPEAEAALAWCLREATTNILRHSAAGACSVNLIQANVDGRTSLTLEVTDDGRGAPEEFGRCGEHSYGNGLTGLAERLAAVGGTLSAGAVAPRGFRILATVPMNPQVEETGAGEPAAGSAAVPAPGSAVVPAPGSAVVPAPGSSASPATGSAVVPATGSAVLPIARPANGRTAAASAESAANPAA